MVAVSAVSASSSLPLCAAVGYIESFDSLWLLLTLFSEIPQALFLLRWFSLLFSLFLIHLAPFFLFLLSLSLTHGVSSVARASLPSCPKGVNHFFVNSPSTVSLWYHLYVLLVIPFPFVFLPCFPSFFFLSLSTSASIAPPFGNHSLPFLRTLRQCKATPAAARTASSPSSAV